MGGVRAAALHQPFSVLLDPDPAGEQYQREVVG
jgi:hypothetical protein